MTDPVEVSIGLPVYNGERYLAGAIASILAQTYADFELIICDNASTDGTAEICRDFAARDGRVRYHRQPENLGAARNFNSCFDLASGRYFKWMAHDDIIRPRFLEACVRVLDDDPGAVLCQSLVHIVDDEDRLLEVYDHSAYGTGSRRPSERLAARLCANRCQEVFGVIRAEALRDSVRHGSYIGADRALLVELALRGRFALVPEPLFISRDHPHRATRVTRLQDRSHLIAWYDTRTDRRRVFSTWTLYGTCLRLVGRYVSGPGERLRCYGHLLASLRLRWNAAFLVLEPLMAIDPRALRVAKMIKRAVLGPRRRRPQLPGQT